METSPSIRLKVFCTSWLLAVCVGVAIILRYENTSGAVGVTIQDYPSVKQVTLDPKRDTLVMFAHPKCPCTRASMDELNRLMTQSNGKLAAHVFFLQPTNFSEAWVKTGLWQSAAAIPGVAVHTDPGGTTAQKFGAETSGYVLLYNPAGQLLFSGGITSGRAHEGDNAGEDAIIALVNGQKPGITHTPVYGCYLLNEPAIK